MGQLSCYTGKEVKWADAAASDFSYLPKAEDVTKGTLPPVRPGPSGSDAPRIPIEVPPDARVPVDDSYESALT